MTTTTRFRFMAIAFGLLTMTTMIGCATTGQGVKLGYDAAPVSLTPTEVQAILDRGVEASQAEASLLRVDPEGESQTCRMHIIVVDRDGTILGRRSMTDAWGGSVSIAKAKAYTAAAFSSNENALTSRSLGALTQPGGPLWNIGNSNYAGSNPGLIEFPGGLPLYKSGFLVGAVGVSGDGVEQDENVAEGFEPIDAIRIDTVTDGGVPYTQ